MEPFKVLFQTLFVFSAVLDGWKVTCKGNGVYEFEDSVASRPSALEDAFLENFLKKHSPHRTGI